MRKTMIICVAVLGSALAFSAVATAGKPANTDAKKLAAKQCRDEKRADKAAFKATYGKRAMRTCLKGAKTDVKDEVKNAAQECRAERAADPDAFRQAYGSNKSGKNAFGKCVSSKVKAEVEENVETFDNAAQECRAERQADKDAFKDAYGTNRNKRNAFGKCVSSKVKDAEEEPEEPVET